MKFLILQKQLPVLGTPDSMRAVSKALEASLEMFDELKRKGKLECVYSFAGIPGGLAIVDVESHEELDILTPQLPISAFGLLEVYPLADLKTFSENLKKTIAQIR